eukprot:CAMPEP_0203957878 /NCGR_PEP_ID=MMETSP0359-20131031/89567_1 /ASSEMBLY_ACC=CAM_ASM_000338 /TAXON_ID=268821 /ORGANISM="Scrippsiella Hangoei, Strain SHTV-5" /LENGTH=77 /DNA_ID=CAMNT_0050891773 /DNA_START=37 /DNA_END=270 /DNA_ORIENTATION=-
MRKAYVLHQTNADVKTKKPFPLTTSVQDDRGGNSDGNWDDLSFGTKVLLSETSCNSYGADTKRWRACLSHSLGLDTS